ncbi:MAG: hypothetical protein ACRDNL_23710, partial [Spirillospora sp.]
SDRQDGGRRREGSYEPRDGEHRGSYTGGERRGGGPRTGGGSHGNRRGGSYSGGGRRDKTARYN